MKSADKEHKVSMAEEPEAPYTKRFSSQEEAEEYNMIQNIKLSDMEKFRLFCRMMRIGKMISSAKTVK
jgi:hypothetical protein